MKFLNMVTLVIASILLSLFVQPAQAEYIDLDKEKVIQVGICHMHKKKYKCLTVEHEGKMYLVVFDRKGEVYQLELLPPDSFKVIWIRDLI